MASTSSTQRRSDSKQLTRQWALLRLLSTSGRPFGVKDLAEQLGTSKSTIERDLATLENDFALVEESAGKQKKTYRIHSQVRELEGMRLGLMELLALHGAQAALRSLTGTPLYDDLGRLTNKLRGALSERHNGGLDRISRVFLPHVRGAIDYAEHGDVIDELTDGISQNKWTVLEYAASGSDEVKSRRLRPLRLLWHRMTLYLLASIEDRSDITTFAVHRIRAANTEAETFAPPRLDLDAYVQQAFGIYVDEDAEHDVEILFDEDIAWLICERTFHPDEEKTRLEDGRLRYRVRSSGESEILSWIQTYGAHAELIAPAEWRTKIAATCRAMCERYKND